MDMSLVPCPWDSSLSCVFLPPSYLRVSSFASHTYTHLTMMSLATGPNTAELTNCGLNQQKRQAKVCVDYLWYLVTVVGS